MSELADEQLMIQLQNGESEALSHIYERHSVRVWKYVQKRVPIESAEDIFQDFFIRIVDKRHTWKNQPFLLWMYVILRNMINDYYRSKNIEKKYKDILTSDSCLNEDKQDFEDLLESLPTETKKLLLEFFKEGWSYRELADKYNLTEVSLRKRMSRALSFLKKGEHYE